MQLPEFCNGLFDALEKYDTDILPLGLYASDDLAESAPKKPHFQEWQGAIVPYLQSQKCQFSSVDGRGKYHHYDALVKAPESGNIALRVVKFSNIKVRQYGSGYHVDKHENRPERWQKTDLSGHISRLWKQNIGGFFAGSWAQTPTRILLFIGFDKAQRPLERELTALHEELHWEKKDVLYLTRSWPDKADRGFGVRLALWARNVDA